jgi:hypothetical protein
MENATGKFVVPIIQNSKRQNVGNNNSVSYRIRVKTSFKFHVQQ